MSISVSKITKLYGQQKALDNVSFEIKTGEVVGFLGPNGAGKSTMMKIVTCYIPQSEGSASVCGYDIGENPIEVKQNVGYLPEHNPLYLDLYVSEYLQFMAGIHKVSQPLKRVEEMIALTGLTPERKKKIGALSKGYRQRVGLAQALIHDPKVLILDEPTSGLDPNQLIEIRNLIREVGKSKTVLLSTHIMQEVEAMCDRVIIINKGNIVADDSASSLQRLNAAETAIIVEFDREVDPSLFKQLTQVVSVRKIQDQKWLFIGEGDKDFRQELFNLAVKENLSILTLQKKERNLEDVFQQLTKS